MILKTDPAHPADETLDLAAARLSAGSLVVAPTETRYGLLARADRQDVLEKLYAVKKRNLTNPTALLVRDRYDAGRYGHLGRAASILAERFFPGPLTLVVRATEKWPAPRVVDGKIGLRCSSAPIIQGLLARLAGPVSATSANISGRMDPDGVEEIEADFGEAVSLYLDAGPLTGLTSTVIDCSGARAKWLRDGAIGRDEIEGVIGKVYD